ncbi:VWA domain-containing protein (plasmid) [Deinococcus sp. KNUC1210]|uniref:VWA domain-containing protein n=1 Tax=Deinococcus sp. KNUC1210 TaxID=2917691 RepID=UPI001EF0BEAF|nr:VWA domain-containing protein [Deinococcus sp. KNUC1210]ULH16973.1 VWA domain-containing protein [Deinococcus sp. KNUC1210]
MQILQTGQRLTLPDPRLQLQLSGAAANGVIAAFTAQGQPTTVDLAEHPLGDLLSVPQAGQLALDLSRLPAAVQTVTILYAAGAAGEVLLTSGSERYGYEGPATTQAVRLMEFYRRDGQWRLYAAGEEVGSFARVHAELPGLLSQATTRMQTLKAQAARPPAPAVDTVRPPSPSAPPLTLNKRETQARLLTLAKDQAPGMVPLIEQARLTLEKRGLDVLTFEVKLVLDVSASMMSLFQSGQVQRLVERSLALAARLDDNGEVEVTLFGTHARSGGNVLLSNIQGYVHSMRFQYDGGTKYAPAIREMIAQQRGAQHPLLVLFITDGEAGDQTQATQALRDASHLPIFFKFLALDSGNERFSFLEQLDTMPGRVVDNANFARIQNLSRLPDTTLFELLTEEIDQWLPAAKAAGVLDGRAQPLGGQSGGSPGPGGGPTPPDNRPWWKKLLN